VAPPRVGYGLLGGSAMTTIIPPAPDPNFNSFLQQMHEESGRRLAELPKAPKPATPPSGPTDAEIEAQSAAEKAAQVEADWKAQVKERKRLERERRLAEEKAAREQASQPTQQQHPPPEPEPQTPRSLAKRKLRDQEQQREEEREKQRQEELRVKLQWEQDEWGPLLRQNRQAIREKHKKAEEDFLNRMRYEHERMSSEDAAAARFACEVAAECARRSHDKSHKADATEAGDNFVKNAVEAEKEKKRRAEFDRQEQIRERQQEDLKKDQEYIEWRAKVRAERCRQVRIDERDRGGPEVDRLAKIGRDYAREHEVHRQQVLEQQRRRAEEVAQERLKTTSLSPRDILKEAQKKAEQQAQQRAKEEPVQREAEEFDTILARHRLARQQERKRGERTPRWGLAGGGLSPQISFGGLGS